MLKMSGIGGRIKLLRRNKGLSQAELGKVLNVAQRTVSSIEQEISNPTIQQLEALSLYFGVSVDYLMFGIEMPTQTDRELLKLIKEDSGLMQSLMDVLAAKKNVFNRLAV